MSDEVGMHSLMRNAMCEGSWLVGYAILSTSMLSGDMNSAQSDSADTRLRGDTAGLKSKDVSRPGGLMRSDGRPTGATGSTFTPGESEPLVGGAGNMTGGIGIAIPSPTAPGETVDTEC